MRLGSGLVGVLLAACGGGGGDVAMSTPAGDGGSPAVRPAPEAMAPSDLEAGTTPTSPGNPLTPPIVDAGTTPTGAQGPMSTPGGEAGVAPSGPDNEPPVPDAPSVPPDASAPANPAFHVLEPLANDIVEPDDDPNWITRYMQLFTGGEHGLFGVSSVLVMDPDGVRIAAQVFRWVPGEEAITLDDNTPWKRLRFADAAGRWLAFERGSGAGTAQGAVWSEALGLHEIAVGNGVPILVQGVSRDGSVVVGDAQGDGGWRSYRWTAADGAQFFELPGGSLRSGSASLSADGRAVFGTTGWESGPSECYRWLAPQAPELFDIAPVVDGWERSGCGVTREPAADGSATAGTVSYLDPEAPMNKARWEAFHWSAEAGAQTIAPPSGFDHTQAYATSEDGQTVYGQAWTGNSAPIGEQPFRWTAESGTVALGIVPGGSGAELLAVDDLNRSGISQDGATVVGNTSWGDTKGFLWSVNTGLVELRPLSGHDATTVTHLSPSGQVAAGVSVGAQGAEVEAVLWDVNGEPRSIRTLLGEAGVDIGDFDFDSETDHDVAVLDEGKRVIGVGTTAQGVPAAWAADLP